MVVLHITPLSNGYEVVKLLANAVNKRNTFAVIEKNGEIHMTGGWLIHDTPEIRRVLDAIPRHEQYAFVEAFKRDPFKKFYYED